MAARNLAIEYVNISTLHLNPQNPRIHSEKQLSQLAKSIQTFGFVVPVIVDGKSRVIAGHGRVLACEKIGVQKVPAIRIVSLSEHQIRAFTITDNKLTENALWDETLLGQQFKILSEAELNFDLEITGFEGAEIDLLIEDLSSGKEPDAADSLPPRSSLQVTQLGDLWKLGKHRVFCADARLPESFDMLTEGQRAHMVFTDPPYNVPIAGHASGKGSKKHSNFVMGSGELTESQFNDFLRCTFGQLVRNTQDASLHYIFTDWRHIRDMLVVGKSLYPELKNVVAWVKDNPGMGSFYRSQHELVIIFQNGKSSRNNVQLGRFGRSRSNVWNYPAAHSFASSKEEGNLLELHPTVKPVALVADAILDCTARGNIVLDPFLGSGTTIISAEKTGRVGFGIELDPMYVDIAIRRWQKFTGQYAVDELTGQSFNEREKEKAHAEKQ